MQISERFEQKNGWLFQLVIIATIGLGAFLGWYASPLALIALVALFGALFLFATKGVGLPLLVLAAFVVPIEFGPDNSFAVSVVVLLIPVLLVRWLLQRIFSNESPVLSSPTFLPLALLAAVATFAWIFGNANWDPRFPQPPDLLAVQFLQWSTFILSVVAFFLAAQQSEQTLRRVTWLFIALGALALLGRYGGTLGRALFYNTVARSAVTNGTFFVWFTALAGGQALFNRKLSNQHRFLLFALALSVPVLGFAQNTQWTTSWLPALIVLATLFWWRFRSASVIIIIAAFLLALFFSGYLLTVYDWEAEQLSVIGRFQLYHAVLDLAMEQPLFGLGLTAYRHYHFFIPLLIEGGAQWYNPQINSHNLYIDLFAQMGLLGLLTFGWVMMRIARLIWKLKDAFDDDFRTAYVAGAAAGFVGMLLASAMVEWLLPFVYNVGVRGFRFSVFSWLFLGGLLILEKQIIMLRNHNNLM